MSETNLHRKNKVNLEDYNYKQDIKNRLMMLQFSSTDISVLEEIIYGSTKLSILKLQSQLEMSLEEVQESLQKLMKTELFSIEGDTLLINKEARKYFENQIIKFEEDFNPGMDFLQKLLKKVPIHVLPNWYPIPRTSNNIFDSLIEKYMQTPQTFQRYLSELQFGNEVLNGIIKDLFNSPTYKIYSKEIKTKYQLSDAEFEEHILLLEFNFVCCLVYEKKEGQWHEAITLFKEWKDYLSFKTKSQPKAVSKKDLVNRSRPNDFSFVEDMSSLLILANTIPITLTLNSKEQWVPEENKMAQQIANKCMGFDLKTEEGQSFFINYISNVIYKLTYLKLARIENRQLIPEAEAEDWLTLPSEKKAIHIYKLTLSRYEFSEFPDEICTERNIREIEKSLSRILDSDWVIFDDFMHGIIAPISDKSKMMLKKTGRYWQYTLPDYSEAESSLIHKIIYEWLFESGMIATGLYQGKECMRITPLGQSLFG